MICAHYEIRERDTEIPLGQAGLKEFEDLAAFDRFVEEFEAKDPRFYIFEISIEAAVEDDGPDPDEIEEYEVTVSVKFRGTASDNEAMERAAEMAQETLNEMASVLGVDTL
jgi:hypothetical protein